jgi:uncharacterized membrane protein YagU involved in acid resistance
VSDLLLLLVLGIVAGLVASAVMEAYQALAATPFGQTGAGDSSTVKFADKLSVALTGAPVTQKRRARAGRLVHYVTGIALGILYVMVAPHWPPITWGFGIAYGVAVAIVLDYVVVPALALGPPAWKTPLATHAYGLSAHIVFGAALEGARRIAGLLM